MIRQPMQDTKEIDISKVYKDVIIIGHTGKLRFSLKSKIQDSSIELWYYNKCGQQPAAIKLARFIPLNESTLIAFGLIQAECGKSELKEFSFSNSNPELILLIIDYFENTWRIPRNFWSCSLYLDKDKIDNDSKELIKNFWVGHLSLNNDQIKVYISTKKSKSVYGNIQIRIYSKVFLGVVLYFLNKIIRPLVENDLELSKYYLRGLLSGDGFVCTTDGKISCFGVSFDPYSNEKNHYEIIFKNLGILPNKSSLKENSKQLAFTNWGKYCKLLQSTNLQPFIEKEKNIRFFRGLVKHPYAKRLLKLKELFETKTFITVNDYQKVLYTSNRNANRNLVKFVNLDILERIRKGRKDFYHLTENGKNLFGILDGIGGDKFEK